MNKIEHLLVCLMEECAEVQQSTSKALRFTLDDHYPEHLPVIEMIRLELADLVAVVQMLKAEGVDLMAFPQSAVINKKKKMQKMMEYAREQGALTDEALPTPTPVHKNGLETP